MNDDTTTPTPRTDADERMAWNAEYMVPTETARELERELTAMTEQRDGLRSGIDYASEQLHKVTEQRDRLADALSFVVSCGYDGPLPKYARDKAQEALAAVKGGSNE
jgi:hypothetical protein